MAVGFGQNAWVGFGEESTYGTPAGAYKYLEIQEESFNGKQSWISKPSLRQVSQKNKVKSKKSVEGGFKFQMPFVGAETVLKHALGAVGGVTGTNPYTRTFSLAPGLPTGLTFQVNRDAANIGGSSMFVYEGCQIQKLTLSQSAEDFLMCQVDVLGEDWNLAALATPTFPTFVGVDWEMVSSALLNAVAFKVEEFEMTIENALAGDRYQLGLRTRKGLGRSGVRKISGKLTLEFESLTEYTHYLNLAEVPLSMVWTSGANYQLTFTLPKVVLSGEDPMVKDPGPIKLPLSYEAYQNAAADDELSITLKNTLATAI